MAITYANFLKDLSYGELSNLKIGEDGQAELSGKDLAKMTRFTNRGLKILSSRFQIIKNEVWLQSQDDKAIYNIRKEHGITQGGSNDKYLVDTVESPFTDEVVQILAVYGEDGSEIPLNDMSDDNSFHTLGPDILQVTHPGDEKSFSIIYQASHPDLVSDLSSTQMIRIPEYLEEALTAYVTSRHFSSLNGEEHKLTSQEEMARFEIICGEVRNLNLTSASSVGDSTKLEDRGFV